MVQRAGERRRAALVESALVTLRDRGLNQVRIKDVAEAAGVSTGTVHYHFADLEELFVRVNEMAVERFVGARSAAVAGTEDARAKMRALIDSGVADDETDALVAALYELAPMVRRNDTHRLLMRSLWEQQTALYSLVLEVGRAQGHFAFTAPASDLAANAVALEDAYGLHIWAGTQTVSPSKAIYLMRLHAAQVTHCQDLLADPNQTE